MDYPMEAKNSGWFSSLRRTRRTEGECGANVKSLEDIASSAAVDASDDAVTQVKKSWRSLFHRKTRKLSSSAQSSSSSSSCEYENVNSVRNETETETVTAQFWTLPRKRNATGPAARLCAVASPPALPPAAAAAPVRRLRSFSSSTLVAKRSTVWYQQCSLDGGVRVANDQLKDEIAEVTAEMESMDNGEESKNAARAKQLSLGRKKFNMDPKKGIEFLLQQGLLHNTPLDIAAFLYRGEGLSKTAIGDYLGEKSPFHEQVLKAFVDLHDFTDLILVQALRQFLWSFRLPGEAQKIDRMMETFAQRYCQLNTNIFSNSDTCYVLSFAVIMLNTSLHNPSVKEKSTLDQFITMNRGINDGKDLPRDILESLYESIKAEPFKIPEDDGNDLMHTFFNPDREGWLWKQGGRYKSWKRRWFILNDNCLYYFEYTTDKEPRGIIPLENIQVREVQDRNKPNCFELYATGGNDFIKACKTDSEGKVVEGKHTVYRMSAGTLEEKDDWIACIRQSISHNPFYDMLAARKKKAQKSGSRSKT